ncbi:hypothetical protein [Streptomyces spectabilis]|uniref:Uncharacterized protein n=1 Tax=Streptomyces spectabilis TaxID=68270 RepID=A0A5P2XMU5_STRST|nr:hypothetical protein [Streptomyces spectabilis]MBB5101924.1 hypothetical protein [Streptomyces spectabilis]MCI3906976.1 hypothetical protein [Streptomyces spectabilis]QEV63762.1 hypothetical protein CP982_37865 [Streptomyces spectabilis]GGV35113.1 hypothetical protein GCM10010245_56330 [Streptomyces spectabilis]
MTIFRKAPDHSDLLHQILRELGELRQRADAQERAADQARQDANAAISRGLAEIRAVVRDGLDRCNDTIRDPLIRISTELVAVRAAIAAISEPGRDRPVAEPPAAGPAPVRHAEPAPPKVDAHDAAPAGESGDGHTGLLRKAAGISSAKLEVHRDTWAFLVEHAGQDRHFHIPGAVREEKGTVTVDVSGLSLVAVLTSLDATRHTSGVDPGTVAIAHHLYERVADTVRSLAAPPHPAGQPVAITIDDRMAAPDGEDRPPTRS